VEKNMTHTPTRSVARLAVLSAGMGLMGLMGAICGQMKIRCAGAPVRPVDGMRAVRDL